MKQQFALIFVTIQSITRRLEYPDLLQPHLLSTDDLC